MRTRQLILRAGLACGALALTACATNQTYLDPEMGLALREAYAKQIVDPTPAAGPPTVNAEKAKAAIDRYLNDEIKDPSPEEGGFILTE